MKVSLLASVIAALAMNGGTLLSTTTPSAPEKDTRIIVELSRGLSGLSVEQVKSSQKALMGQIRNDVSSHFNFVKNYSVLNNAIVLDVNHNDVEAIRNMKGVKSVTVDEIHWKRNVGENQVLRITRDGGDPVVEENISATTMEKPTDTNDGEGTVIAILDNEFYLRGESEDGASWYHETYTTLPSGTIERFTFDNLGSILGKGTHATRKPGKTAGQEGSCYFNNKVPFYYDYGGDTNVYGKVGSPDYNVSTKTSYHGSHVASIAAGNAPTYKGISPKAQLACMKVFTDYTADKVASDMGFATSSGAYDTAILTALEDCILLGVDGINMSLGSDLDDFDGDSITLRTLTRLSEAGIMSAISAGNSGKSSYSFAGGYGNWTSDMVETGILSSYANNKSVTTVASGQPDRVYFEHALHIDGHNVAYEDQIVNREGLDAEFNKEFKLEDLLATATEFDYVYVPGFGRSEDYNGLDVKGKIAVVNRGTSSFADKYKLAKDLGAIALIIINNDPTASDFNFRCSFGEDFDPSMPCALVLYKDKPFFESKREGKFTLVSKEVAENDNKRTISTYSSDGATFDFDFKPEITAPGELIRGAVPPQKKEDKENTPYSTYEYLSGTSMSAPNYAGAQALVYSKVAKDVYSNANPTAEEIKAAHDYRNTVDMRLMSTANPMLDVNDNPEDGTKSFTSPRMQGAGMVDLDGALNTKVYLEGLDLQGNKIGKSKIALHNNDDIARGVVNLSFLAHNESTETLSYNVKLTVMRPAIAKASNVLPDLYSYNSEIDSIDKLPGVTYYDEKEDETIKTTGKPKLNDAYKSTKVIEYYKSKADYLDGIKTTILPGFLVYTSNNAWEPLPESEYQSVQDITLAEVTGQTVSIAPGESTVTIDSYSLTQEAKDEILRFYQYGCAIEGFVTLEATGSEPDLNIPYLGFYSGTDVDESKSYASAPAVEPMAFEKSLNQIYPSDLVNDIAKSLVGKDNADMGSMMVAGYAPSTTAIDVDSILYNKWSWEGIKGFEFLGKNPGTEYKQYFDDVENNLYIGNPKKSNTLIIQQFVLRSVDDNYFTITNKETGKVAYKSVLEDMLYGDQYGRYPLYKSHVDSSYLGNGIVAHRAYAIVPLYNEETGEPFADGTYEITFNYLLAATQTWQTLTYTLHVDSTAPEFTNIEQYDDNGTERVRVEFKDASVCYASLGLGVADFNYDEEKDVYYIDETKEVMDDSIEEIGETLSGQKRFGFSMLDSAGGITNVICHFWEEGNYNSECVSVQGPDFDVSHNDFIDKGDHVEFIDIVDAYGTEVPASFDNYTVKVFNRNPAPTPAPTPAPNGCSGSGAISCLAVTIVASVSLVTLFFFRRKKVLGGK